MLRVLRFADGAEHRSRSCHSHEYVSHMRQTASLRGLLMGAVGTNGPEMGNSNQGSVFYYTTDLSWS